MVDFRKLNKRLIPDPYPIPRAKELNRIFIPTRLGFGGSNCPAYMRRLSNYLYGDLEDVCVYIDDILIASSDWTSHLESLREVFQRTRDAKLRIAVSKAQFALSSIDYVGL